MKSNNNQELALNIDGLLKKIANILLINSSFTNNLGLLNGKMGIAIFFYHYSKFSNSNVYERYADALIDEIYKEIGQNTPINFENGLTGIGWGIEYLVKNGFVQADTDETLSEIDTIIYRSSLYSQFLLRTGNDLFAYGLYYINRLRDHGEDENNLNTLFIKQHLIYLIDECERIFIHKKFLEYKINFLTITSINSFIWFFVEIYRLEIFPSKVEKLLHYLPLYIRPFLDNPVQIPSIEQLAILLESLITSISNTELLNTYRDILVSLNEPSRASNQYNYMDDPIQIFIQRVWQMLIYKPNIEISYLQNSIESVYSIISDEQNWNKRLNTLDTNLGFNGLAGIGLGFLFFVKKDSKRKIT